MTSCRGGTLMGRRMIGAVGVTVVTIGRKGAARALESGSVGNRGSDDLRGERRLRPRRGPRYHIRPSKTLE